MNDPIWQEPPTVPLLQWLARGSLKQNLLQTIRLWVWLRLFYGDDDERLHLPTQFSYAELRDRIFTSTHPTTDQKPSLHDETCPCAKPTAAWLFNPDLSLTAAQWRQYQSNSQQQQLIQTQVEQFRQALIDHDQRPTDLDTLLFATRLFGYTRRTFYGDLRRLADIHWLTQENSLFTKVSTWPNYPRSSAQTERWALSQDASFLTQPDLAAIADNMSQPLSDTRRFFVHVDYVVSRQQLDRVDDWQALLAELWQQTPVPPVVKLHYQAAGASKACELIVYPVCIYYYRRGPYLCAYGQFPQSSTRQALDWRNYRLDRITAIEPMTWGAEPSTARIPPQLYQRYLNHTLPTPDDIATAMDDAWGFDYYQPSQLLLLRFDTDWDRRYIQNTLRHSTFCKVSYAQAKTLIQQQLTGEQQQQMLNVICDRASTDAYYQAQYRHNDPNVRQRLRAWRPHVEVLLPWDLRQRTIQEIQQEMAFYGL